MQGLRATQTEDFALGADLFAKMLYATERVDTPLAELQQIGEADLNRNQAALAEACAAYAPGRSIKQCVASVDELKPDGGDAVAYARKQLRGAAAVRRRTRAWSPSPAREEAKVKQSPPYKSQNSRLHRHPRAVREGHALVLQRGGAGSFLAEGQSSWPTSPASPDLLFTSVHEVWPGHFLQFLHLEPRAVHVRQAVRGLCLRRRLGALRRGDDVGGGPGQWRSRKRISASCWKRSLRNARCCSAIGLHTQRHDAWRAVAAGCSSNTAYQDEGNSEQQAARGAYDPAYLNYTMGKLMIRRLRADWCGKRGGAEDKACWRQFHDAFLSYGGPPIPLVRGAMLGEPAKSAF